jgi:hypothetical protein
MLRQHFMGKEILWVSWDLLTSSRVWRQSEIDSRSKEFVPTGLGLDLCPTASNSRIHSELLDPLTKA